MRIVCLTHAEYEAPEAIATWAKDRGHELTCVVPLFEQFPPTDDFEMLVIMGGPMGAYEDAAYPWLVAEKAFIRTAVEAGKLVLGVCLGAQLTACALGGAAHPHSQRELGWYPVYLTAAGRESRVLSILPRQFVAGLWHGDTYDLPAGLATAAVSDACPNQAFESHGGRVVGLQFHLEWTEYALRELAHQHPDWFEAGGEYVCTRDEFVEPGEALAEGQRLLYRLLDEMESLA